MLSSSTQMPRLIRLIIPLIVLGLGFLAYHRLSQKEELATPPRPERRIIEVEAAPLKLTDYQVTLHSQGIAEPHNQTSLTPRVGGRIIHISPKFESGSFFEPNEVLLELDQSDFLAAEKAAEARLARAQATLVQEEARAEQALLDWNDLGYTTPPTDLVLRKPQLKEAEANVKAAEAELAGAQRDLARTKILAPYAGRVKSRLVGLGQSVSSSTPLGEIYSTDFAEIRLSLSARELSKVTLPNNPDDPPLPVTLFDALNDDSTATWEALIVRTEGALDEQSRKLFVIARVDDPFGLKNPKAQPLLLGQPVRAQIAGDLIPQVFIIPRATLRRPEEILLVHPTDFTLQRQIISPIWSDQENLIVRDGLIEGWQLVTNRLTIAPNGAKVIIIEPSLPDPKAAASSLGTPPQA